LDERDRETCEFSAANPRIPKNEHGLYTAYRHLAAEDLDGSDVTAARVQTLNPHIKFYNARRGYVRITLTPSLWTTDYRTVSYVTRPDAPIETVQSFVVEAGQPGLKPA
jgi:phosphodiesterase/alkaline phosphatase D-like protein